MQNINISLKQCDHATPCLLVSNDSLACVLAPGTHRVRCKKAATSASAAASESCGIVPLQGHAHITTRGLKWELSGQRCEWSGLISTSNAFAESAADESASAGAADGYVYVDVECDRPVLWTVGCDLG
jgi:thiamine pyrophosphokinase